MYAESSFETLDLTIKTQSLSQPISTIGTIISLQQQSIVSQIQTYHESNVITDGSLNTKHAAMNEWLTGGSKADSYRLYKYEHHLSDASISFVKLVSMKFSNIYRPNMFIHGKNVDICVLKV
jgi:hypothetical protein